MHTSWIDLPNPVDSESPINTVTTPQHRWRHIVKRHIAESAEPWDELLPGDVLTRMEETLAFACDDPQVIPLHEALASVLERQARQSLSRPLVVAYSVQCRPDEPSEERRLLVLPSGALAVLGQSKRGWSVLTAYFVKAACRAKSHRRWKECAKYLLVSYARLDVRYGVVQPDAAHQVTIRHLQKPTEIRERFRFLTEASWGFQANLRGKPWRTVLADWQETAATPPRTQLHRRRRRGSKS